MKLQQSTIVVCDLHGDNRSVIFSIDAIVAVAINREQKWSRNGMERNRNGTRGLLEA